MPRSAEKYVWREKLCCETRKNVIALSVRWNWSKFHPFPDNQSCEGASRAVVDFYYANMAKLIFEYLVAISGDASSPHGATCSIQFTSATHGSCIGGISSNSNSSSSSSSNHSNGNHSSTGNPSDASIYSKSPSPSSPGGTGNEGLTRQQLDLITQIMQQTKQANAAAAAAASAGQKIPPRPRTWNMQVSLSLP